MTSESMRQSYHEVAHKWTLTEVAQANEVLDALDEAQAREYEKASRK